MAQSERDLTDAMPVTFAGRSDAGDFASHVVRHIAESGHAAEQHFSPVWGLDRGEVAAESERRWATPVHQPGWGRAFLLWAHAWSDPSRPRPTIVGHVELRGPLVASALHRAELSIGIEAPYRGRGHGRGLIGSAIEWARTTNQILYLDLRVFSHNAHARALYERFGFERAGAIEDAFRMLDGTRVDDVLMVKRLGG
jgi:RimJ/RimL family protein N-acetyltransferase